MRFAPRVLVATAVAAVLPLAACGSTADHPAGGHSASAANSATASGSSARPAVDHNAADVTFATGMIPHHGQAIAMADLAAKQAGNSQVAQLAVQVKAAQAPEIKTLSGWLSTWGAPVPSTDMSGHDMSGHDMGGMTGMMSAAEMRQLAAASGAAFDKLWLQLMIKHHQGAIQMAQAELATGQNQPAKALAQSIKTSQAKEIAAMRSLLSSLS